MSPRIVANAQRERCPVCGGTVCATQITHEHRRGEWLSLVDHVPEEVCTACGEVWIDETTLGAGDRLIRTATPTRTIEMLVYSFDVTT